MNNTATLDINPWHNLQRKLAVGTIPTVLSDIYKDDVNIAIWQHELSSSLIDSVTELIKASSNFKVVMIASPDSVVEKLLEDNSAWLINKNFANTLVYWLICLVHCLS